MPFVTPPYADMDNRDLVAMLKDVKPLPVTEGEEIPYPVAKANEYAALCHEIGQMLETLRYSHWLSRNWATRLVTNIEDEIKSMQDRGCATIYSDQFGDENRIQR